MPFTDKRTLPTCTSGDASLHGDILNLFFSLGLQISLLSAFLSFSLAPGTVDYQWRLSMNGLDRHGPSR